MLFPDGASALGDWQPVKKPAAINITASSREMGFMVFAARDAILFGATLHDGPHFSYGVNTPWRPGLFSP
jgi:hypothetical protein